MDGREYRKSLNGDTIVILFTSEQKIRKAGVKLSPSGEQYIFCDLNYYVTSDLAYINRRYPLNSSVEEYEAMLYRITLHLKEQINAYSENVR